MLIPRQDTEILVERALSLMDGVRSPRILDLCCGSGAIGIALLTKIPGATCVFADNSPGALRVCRKNVEGARKNLFVIGKRSDVAELILNGKEII